MPPTEQAKAILGADVAALLTDADWALAAAQVAQVTGTETDPDPWLLAAEAVDLLGLRSQATGTLQQVTSEGTTLQMSTADWFGMAARLRGKAKTKTGPSGVGVISIDPGGTDFIPRSAGSGGGYWEADGDVPRWHPWMSPPLPSELFGDRQL